MTFAPNTSRTSAVNSTPPLTGFKTASRSFTLTIATPLESSAMPRTEMAPTLATIPESRAIFMPRCTTSIGSRIVIAGGVASFDFLARKINDPDLLRSAAVCPNAPWAAHINRMRHPTVIFELMTTPLQCKTYDRSVPCRPADGFREDFQRGSCRFAPPLRQHVSNYTSYDAQASTDVPQWTDPA